VVLARAVAYFFREAASNLLRSWKISMVAVSSIAVSLFVGGTLLLLLGNLQRLVADWRREAKVIVYLQPGVAPRPDDALVAELRRPTWVTGVATVTAAEARRRFERYFPSVADLVRSWGEDPLPGSYEVAFDPQSVPPAALDAWTRELRTQPGVAMVDDDRDWVRQVEGALHVIGALGLAVVAVLLVAAIFTIASIIRLTAYLYRDEIGVMRLVGATELFIRGPFYIEGLLQGLLGGACAVAALYAGYRLLVPHAPVSWLSSALTGAFLPAAQQMLLVGLGALAGLVGAIASLRREDV
jgi:cell division transport system permease protein